MVQILTLKVVLSLANLTLVQQQEGREKDAKVLQNAGKSAQKIMGNMESWLLEYYGRKELVAAFLILWWANVKLTPREKDTNTMKWLPHVNCRVRNKISTRTMLTFKNWLWPGPNCMFFIFQTHRQLKKTKTYQTYYHLCILRPLLIWTKNSMEISTY